MQSKLAGLDRALLRGRAAQLLAPYQGTPGVTIGVFQAGETLLHDSAGLASLELGIPIGPDTVFRIASVSKQFTCAAILMLAEEGRLDVQDDVRRHLPEVPDMGGTVTLAHLMHNTSGIRDMLEIMRQGGADLAQPCTPDDLMAAICRQRTLNFPPGSRFLYSNSSFLLLGRVVERVAGEALASFLRRRIFAPLGMNRTRMTEDLADPVAGLATGYLPRPDGPGFLRARHAFPLHGEGGLVSCVQDLAIWERNFTTGRVGGTALGEALVTQAPFTNGTMNFYARGLAVRPYRGVQTVTHGGLWPGYKTEFLRVPERGLAIIAIANHGGADPGLLAHHMLDALLDGSADPAPPPAPAMPPGRYMNEATGQTLEIETSPEGTALFRSFGSPMAPDLLPDGRIGVTRGISCLTVRRIDDDAIAVEQDAGVTGTWRRVTPGAVLPPDLPGRYASPEMAAEWTITAGPEGTKLHMSGPLLRATTPCALEPVTERDLRAIVPNVLAQFWIDVRVVRNAAGAIEALIVSGGRAKAVRYQRVVDE